MQTEKRLNGPSADHRTGRSQAEPPTTVTPSPHRLDHVTADGKHFALAGQAFRVHGVTYGSFLPRADGEPFPESDQVASDFKAMRDLGLNVVRTYAVPPPDVLELARDHDLRMIVGLHYHDWRMEKTPGRRARRRILDAGRRSVEQAMERCAGNPTVLAVSIGNEVPGDLVRVHGITTVETVLSEVATAVHAADPQVLVTYSNYPTTEYLQIDGLDLLSFNVFLERPDKLRPYLRHLQVVSGNRPLLVSELGLCSVTHGLEAQAESLEWQLELVDEAGCAGATVFSWTDEWGVAGEAVEGWGFGITSDDRSHKAATTVVGEWARRGIADLRPDWPKVSVVVCAYNEAEVIGECLDSLRSSRYPNLEVIVCDDGSSDDTLSIARRYPFTILELRHGGLSAARNAGIDAATGEVVAFLDADASCHPDWLFHTVLSLEDEGVVGTGGPNLPVPGVGFAERAVGHAPGGATHVLTSDDRAEHVPGCNMAFQKKALTAVGGFDPAFTSAGDDVDLCWKVLDLGWEIAFSPAAQVHHHRRSTFRGYLRQQRNYGRSERMVAGRHRHRFNRLGQARWSGFIYGGQRLLPSLLRPIVYHGYQGRSPYQTVTRRRAEAAMGWASALLPLAAPLLLVGAVLSFFNLPIGLALVAISVISVMAYAGSVLAAFRPERSEPARARTRLAVTWLHVAQPFVRAWGRLRGRALAPLDLPALEWTGDRSAWLSAIQQALATKGVSARIGPPNEDWDLRAVIGPFVRCSITTAVAWHWNPVYRVRTGIRPWLLPALAVVALSALASWTIAAVAGAIVAISLLTEMVVLKRRVRSALASTTNPART